jgi:lysophospholipase L1-like esterase
MLDLMGHICPTKECVRSINGASQRPDGLHPDGVGAEEMSRWTLAQLLTHLPARAVDGGP